MTQQNRRTLSNIVVDSKALIRLSFPFGLFLILSLVIIGFLNWKVSSGIAEIGLLMNSGPRLAIALNQISIDMAIGGTIGMTLLGVLCFVLWLVYSHRLIGPTVPIRRHIDNLRAGDYGSRITLRKFDFYKSVATDLNMLAETLENGPKPRK